VRPDVSTDSGFARRGGIVLAGLLAWNLGNYVFFLTAARYLGPRDYGLLAALLAATVVVAVPSQALQFAAARLFAAPPSGDAALAEGIYRRAVRGVAALGGMIAAGSALAVVAIHAFHKGVPAGPLLATIVLVAPLGLFFLVLGRLQGRHRFSAFAVCFALWGAPRPVLLIPLAAAGWGVYAGLGSTAAAVVSAVGAGLWLSREPMPRRRPTGGEWRAVAAPVFPVVVGLAGLGVLTNLDVIVAKVALGANAAGQFAAAAVLAKTVFLIPQATSFVLLPRVAARSAAAEETGTILAAGVGLTLIFGAAASVGMWVLSGPLLNLTYGDGFSVSGGLLAAFTGASTLIGALIVLINHHVGRGMNSFVWGVGGLAVVQLCLLMLLHRSASEIVIADGTIGAGGIVLHEWMFASTTEAIAPGFVRAARHVRARFRNDDA
jgi:O-antigen/teichoic acid export membrane protein